MDAFPTEIWAHIAKFACTDGGFTGRSLSGLCWEMNRIVDPIRYRTLALGTTRQIINFCAFIKKNSVGPGSRSPDQCCGPRVRHLFLGGSNPRLLPRVDLSQRNTFASSLNTVRQLTLDVKSPLPTPSDAIEDGPVSSSSGVVAVDDEVVLKSVAHILYAVSDTVLTIHVCLLLQRCSEMPLSFPFPLLQMIALDGLYLFHPSGREPLFPSLKKLQLGRHHRLEGFRHSAIRRVIPNLSEIALIGVLEVDDMIAWIRAFSDNWPDSSHVKVSIEVEAAMGLNGPMGTVPRLREAVAREGNFRLTFVETKPSRGDLGSYREKWLRWEYP